MAFVVAKDFDSDPIELAAGAFKIQVLDDVPVAISDIDSVSVDVQPIATGNVVTGNYAGATPNDINPDDGVADQIGADGFGSLTGLALRPITSTAYTASFQSM